MGKDFLEKIIEHKREEVALAKKSVPESALIKEAGNACDKRPFFEALNKGSRVNIIAEIKRASPSKGDIDLNLDPAELARTYEKGGAAALSVLTETRFFKGGFNDLVLAREATSLPVLRKDFIIDPYQIYESAVSGADAILLIARILSKEDLKAFEALARDLNMDALVEIHSEEDLEAVEYAGSRLIGINNRNLASFETNTDNATTLVSRLNKGILPIAASGIATGEDIDKNLTAGIHNFLIGESLVKAPCAESLIKSFVNRTVKIK